MTHTNARLVECLPPTLVGSLDWARARRGRLTWDERWAQAGQGVAVIARSLTTRALGLRDRRRIEQSLDEIPWPQTPAVRAADALCAEVSSPALAGHCRRTYLWGALLAQRDGLRFDPELFLIASLLHDLGLVDRFGPATFDTDCFAHAGAEAALRWAHEQGWDEARKRALADAICLHLNARVDPTLGVEAHLLRQGSGLDVLGLRLGNIAATTRRAVLELHPRLGFRREITELARRERRLRPRSRMGCLVSLGFAWQIDRSPFSD